MIGTEKVVVGPGDRLDERNNRVPGAGPTTTVEGCVVEPLESASGSELRERERSGTRKRIRVFLPAHAPAVTAASTLTWRGRRWHVIDEPDEWYDDDPDLSGQVAIAEIGKG